MTDHEALPPGPDESPAAYRSRRQWNYSQPWTASEYLYVDGLPCVYTLDSPSDSVWVHLPGGRRVEVGELHKEGRRIEAPQHWRK